MLKRTLKSVWFFVALLIVLGFGMTDSVLAVDEPIDISTRMKNPYLVIENGEMSGWEFSKNGYDPLERPYTLSNKNMMGLSGASKIIWLSAGTSFVYDKQTKSKQSMYIYQRVDVEPNTTYVLNAMTLGSRVGGTATLPLTTFHYGMVDAPTRGNLNKLKSFEVKNSSARYLNSKVTTGADQTELYVYLGLSRNILSISENKTENRFMAYDDRNPPEELYPELTVEDKTIHVFDSSYDPLQQVTEVLDGDGTVLSMENIDYEIKDINGSLLIKSKSDWEKKKSEFLTYPKECTINFTVKDSVGLSSSKEAKLKVINDPPEIIVDPNIWGNEGKQTVTKGTAFDIKNGVHAQDTEEGDLSNRMTCQVTDATGKNVTNTRWTEIAGTYTLTYHVADSSGGEAEKQLIVVVNVGELAYFNSVIKVTNLLGESVDQKNATRGSQLNYQLEFNIKPDELGNFLMTGGQLSQVEIKSEIPNDLIIDQSKITLLDGNQRPLLAEIAVENGLIVAKVDALTTEQLSDSKQTFYTLMYTGKVADTVVEGEWLKAKGTTQFDIASSQIKGQKVTSNQVATQIASGNISAEIDIGNVDFGRHKIGDTVKESAKLPNEQKQSDAFIRVNDFRGKADNAGWEFAVTQKESFSKKTSAGNITDQLNTDQLSLKAGTILSDNQPDYGLTNSESVELIKNQPVVLLGNTANNQTVGGGITKMNLEKLSLDVANEAGHSTGTYDTTLEWTIRFSPNH